MQNFVSHGLSQEGGGSSFRLDPLVAEQSGIADLERLSLEEKVEGEALRRLKGLQEQAYHEGYQLGLDEGREKAFNELKLDLAGQIESLASVIQSLQSLKTDLLAHNERQIMELVFYIGKRLALDEISTRPEIVLEIVRKAVESTQVEEKIAIKVSPSDHALIEASKEKLGREFDFLKNAKLEASEQVSSGGCIVSTGFGEVNSTIEQRVAKLWSVLSEKLPRVQNIEVGDTPVGGMPEGEEK